MSKARSVPTHLLRRSLRVIRPRDLEQEYARPRQDLQRMAAEGVVLRLAHGYYAMPPADWAGDPHWRPEVEAVALGIAMADHGAENVALAGPSAARVLGFYSRALSTAVVSVPVRRSPLVTVAGKVVFWNWLVSRLETQVWRSELGQGRTSTKEQALLDIAANPQMGDISISTAEEMHTNLAGEVDWTHALVLAESSGRQAAYVRARWFAQPYVPHAPTIKGLRHLISPKGLNPRGEVDRKEFGIRND